MYRINTDGVVAPIPLRNLFAGPQPSACWLIGGGPSLNDADCAAIARSPIPKMAVNLAGAGRLRPNFWTSYDPSIRFHRSIYLDPGVMKFVHRRRATDLVPESTFKVCECPNLFFFDRDAQRSYATLLDPAATGVVDWNDSFVQAVDLLYQLGFRTIYLVGCDFRILPSPAQLELARRRGVPDDSWYSLLDFVPACRQRGLSQADLAACDLPRQYHFDETKPLAAAVNSDQHYFRISQYLRLSRVAIATAGLRLVSVTPESRLNDIFPHRPLDDVLAEIAQSIGDPAHEPTRGLYTQTRPRPSPALGPMRDFKPPREPVAPPPIVPTKPPPKPSVSAPVRPAPTSSRLASPTIQIEYEGPEEDG